MITTAVQQASQIVEVQGALSPAPTVEDEFRTAFAANVGDSQTEKTNQGNGDPASTAVGAFSALPLSKQLLPGILTQRNTAVATSGAAQSHLKKAVGAEIVTSTNVSNTDAEVPNLSSVEESSGAVVDPLLNAARSNEIAAKLSPEQADSRAASLVANSGNQLPSVRADLSVKAAERDPKASSESLKSGASAISSDATPVRNRKTETSSNQDTGVSTQTISAVTEVQNESAFAVATAPVFPIDAAVIRQAQTARTPDGTSVGQDGGKTAALAKFSEAKDPSITNDRSASPYPESSIATNQASSLAVSAAGETSSSEWEESASTHEATNFAQRLLDGSNGSGGSTSRKITNSQNAPASYLATYKAASTLQQSVLDATTPKAHLTGNAPAVSSSDPRVDGSTRPSRAEVIPPSLALETTQSNSKYVTAETAGAQAPSDSLPVLLTDSSGTEVKPPAKTTQVASKLATGNDKATSAVSAPQDATAAQTSSTQPAAGHDTIASANHAVPANANGEVRSAPSMESLTPSLQTHLADSVSHPNPTVSGTASAAHALSGVNGASLTEPAAVATQIFEPHRTLLATPTTLEVGVPGGTQGWLRIRAEVGTEGGVNASLTAGSTEGRELLHTQIPALNAFLHSEHLAVITTVGERASVVADGSQAGTSSSRQGSLDSSSSSLLQGGSAQDSGTPGNTHQQTASVSRSELRRGYDSRSGHDAPGGSASGTAQLSGDNGRWLNVRV